MRITKQHFIAFLKCKRLSWLTDKNNLNSNITDVKEYLKINEVKESIVDGNETGEIAREYFKTKYKTYLNIDIYENESNKITATKKAIENKIEVIFEGFFSDKKVAVKPDVLILNKKDNSYTLIEVKGTTSVKSDHGLDVMFQYFALTKLGLKINNIKLMYLNKNYTRIGDLDLNKLFVISDLFSYSKKSQLTFFQYIEKWSENNDFKEIVDKIITNNSEQELPTINIGSQCSGCEFYVNKFCLNSIEKFPMRDSLSELSGIRVKKLGELLYDHGYKRILEISPKDLTTHNARNRLRVQQYSIANKKIYLETELIKKELLNYKYPLYMIDFETWKSAIPKFNNTKPYEQQVFQYSLHVILNDDFDWKTLKNIKHYEYLSDGKTDDRRALCEQMIKDLTKHGPGTNVAYNKSFEISRIIRMASLFPEFDEELNLIAENFVDLIDFFKKLWIYHYDFRGKSSIKATLPAFEKDFSYDNLEIKKGDQASFTFRQRICSEISWDSWINDYRENMLKYCNQDTLAMVILFDKIQELIK